MVVKLYSSTDANAPQLSIVNDGSLINILRGCLVDGYGTRTPVGWTMPFSDLVNNIVAFKPIDVNVDVHIQIDDNYDYRWHKVKMFRDMTAINIGVGETPIFTDNSFLTGSKREDASSNTALWHVLAGDDFFYFFSDPLNYGAGFFFGKIKDADVTRGYDYLLMGYKTTIGQTSSSVDNSLWDVLAGNHYLLQDLYLSDKYLQAYMNKTPIQYVSPNPITGKLLTDTWKIRDATNVYYGELPNFLQCSGYPKLTVGSRFVIGGIKYLAYTKGNESYLFEYDVDAG